MALHELNLWNVDSRTGSSLDVGDKYGGLSAGRIDLPEVHEKAKGFKARISGTNILESYASLSALLTGIGGSRINNLQGRDAIIEFDTARSSSGVRGVHSIEGIFVREWHRESALTKGEAEKCIMSHGVDEYTWTGTQSVAQDTALNLLALQDFSTDVATGATAINAESLVVLPVEVKTRGLFITVILDGEYSVQGPNDMSVQLRSVDGTTILQTHPTFVLDKKLNKLTVNLSTYTKGVYHELSTSGFKLYVTNDSGSAMTLKEVKIIVQNVSNPDFTRG